MSHGWLFRGWTGCFLSASPAASPRFSCLAPCPGPVSGCTSRSFALGSGLDLVHVVPPGVEGGWTVKSGYFAWLHAAGLWSGVPCCRSHLQAAPSVYLDLPLTSVITPLASLGLGMVWLPAVGGPWGLPIHLISLKPAHALLNNPFVKRS